MRIRVLPCQPHSLIFGGFEVQMLSAIKAVRDLGIDIAPLDVWNREEQFDTLHVWGLEEAHINSVIWAKRGGKKVVMSALLPHLSPKTVIRYFIARILGYKRSQKKILELIDHIVVVNNEQAKTARYLLGIDINKISVIPNVVDNIFFDRKNDDDISPFFSSDYDRVDYLLCVGNICQRKNQLLLAQAAIEEKISLLIIGNILPGDEKYGDALVNLANKNENIKLVFGLAPHSQMIKEAYSKCFGFALLSDMENQPISCLEAAAMGKPLLLLNKLWAKQPLYAGALLVKSPSLKAIRDGIRAIYNHPEQYKVCEDELSACRDYAVGAAYTNVYKVIQMQPTQ